VNNNYYIKCDKLFKILQKNCKDTCTIIYVFPSQLNLNLRRKFEYKYFPLISKRMVGEFSLTKKNEYEDFDTGRKTEYNFDKKYNE